MPSPDPVSLAASVDARFRAAHEPAFAEGQRRFFRHEIKTYGARTKDLHAIARDVYREVKQWPVASRNRFMNLLWRSGFLESQALACHVYRRFSASCGIAEFDLFEQWLDRHVDNWGTCDGVASWLLAASIGNHPELTARLFEWTSSPDRWKRRASAVALLQEAKQGRSSDIIFRIVERLLPDRDDMVQKGVGWLLKETYPKRPRETLEFLMARRRVASRLTLRYAAEKMTPADRRRLLS